MGAFIRGGCGIEDHGALRIVTEVESLVFQLIELLSVEPHPLAGWTGVDLNLVPDRRHQVRAAFRAFHLAFLSCGFELQSDCLGSSTFYA